MGERYIGSRHAWVAHPVAAAIAAFRNVAGDRASDQMRRLNMTYSARHDQHRTTGCYNDRPGIICAST